MKCNVSEVVLSQRFWWAVSYSTLVLNFNQVFSIEHLRLAGYL